MGRDSETDSSSQLPADQPVDEDAQHGIPRRGLLQVVAVTGLLSSTTFGTAELTGIGADSVAAQSEDDAESFEDAAVDDSKPADPWEVFSNGGLHEISDQQATAGSQTLHLAGQGTLTETTVGVNVDLTNVETVRIDVYAVSITPYWGVARLSVDGKSNGVIGFNGVFPGDTTTDTLITDIDGDVSDVTGKHDLLLINSGDNETYYDNLRFLDANGNRIPLSDVYTGLQGSQPPEAFYDFEGSGTTVEDRTGNGYTGELVGADRVSGRGGQVLEFNRDNQEYARLGQEDTLDPRDGSYTVSLWFKSSTDEGYGPSKKRALFAKRGSGNIRFLIQMLDNGWLNFMVKDDTGLGHDGVPTDDTFTDGNWHHVVAVRDVDNDELELYVDGELKGTDTDTQGDIDPTGPAYLGAQPEYPHGDYYTGQIDDVKIYDAAVRPSEIGDSQNTAPTAEFDVNAVTERGLITQFDASASTVSDGTITTYEFDFDGDGTFDASSSASTDDSPAVFTHTYQTIGEKEVTLRVTTDTGVQDTATESVNVRLLNSPEKESIANTLDQESSLSNIANGPIEDVSISDTTLANRTISDLHTGVENGTIDAGPAEDAIERMLVAERETREIIHRVGPAGDERVTIDPENEEPRSVQVNLAQAFAENIFTIGLRAAITIVTARYVMSKINDPLKKVPIVGIEDLATFALENTINLVVPFDNSVFESLIAKAETIVQPALDGVVTSLDEFVGQVESGVEDLVSQFELPFRMAVELAELDPTSSLSAGILDGPGEPIFDNLRILHEDLGTGAIQNGLQGSTANATSVATDLGTEITIAIEDAFKSIKTSNPLKPFGVELDFSPISLIFEIIRDLVTEGDPFASEGGFDQFIDLLGVIAGLAGGVKVSVALAVLQPSAGIVGGLPVLFYTQSAHNELIRSTIQGEETGDLLDLSGNTGGGS